MKMSYRMFIDDERFPPDDGNEWKIVRSYQMAVYMIEMLGMPNFVSFDHDLGDEANGDGYKIAKYLCDLDMNSTPAYKFPEDFDYFVHSQNPIGKANIEGYMDGYLKQR